LSAGQYPIFAREGWAHVAIAVAIAICVHVVFGKWWAFPFWIATVFVLQFFRDPPRVVPDMPGAVVCPADGRVIVVDETTDPYLNRRARRVSIFMNVFNVHSNRMPVAGHIVKRWYHAGRFLNAALDKASAENERNALHVRSDDGHDLVVVQIAGLIARRILCHVAEGARVARGERYGFIRFGSRVDVYLPLSADVRVFVGDKASGASDILAVLLR
jgi:phosphatidylserine decarboxylase